MNFEKMSILDIFQYNMALAVGITMIGIITILIGICIYIISDEKSHRILSGAITIMGILAVIFFNVTIVTNNQSEALMNGETTTDIQSVYHINGDKIAKLNVDEHPIRLDIDDNLKKGDRIHLKAKNVEIRRNNTIKYDSLKGKQAFQYEKVNE